MFKTIPIIVMATLCLNFNTKAQENKAVDVTSKGIQIGQMVPDITITNLHNYKDKDGKLATTAKLSDFKGKLLILDFWATWCSPCIAMIPKMDSLQKQFGDKIQFLSVTYQNEKEVLPFLEKYEKQKGKHYDLPVVTSDIELAKLFPHSYLPHYVWIGKDGKVIAITELGPVNSMSMQMLLSGRNLDVQQKIDAPALPYDKEQPLFIAGNGGIGNTLLFHSLISSYTPGLFGGNSFRKDSTGGVRISCINLPILQIYRTAYSDKDYFGDNRTLILAKDTAALINHQIGASYEDWMNKGHAFCYEVMVPFSMRKDVHAIMREELNHFFRQYNVHLEKRKVKCLVLTRTSNIDKIHSKGAKSTSSFTPFGFTLQNFPLSRLIAQLNNIYLQNSPLPIVNNTGYKEWVDISINANLSDVSEMNRGLAKYDLKFIIADRDIDMMVILDR